MTLQTDGILDVHLKGDPGSGLFLKASGLADPLKNGFCQMLLDEKKCDIDLTGEGQPQKRLGRIETLAAGRVNYRAARRPQGPRRLANGAGLLVRDQRHDQFELHCCGPS